MTSIPIPFLTAFLLLILAGVSHHQLRATPTGRVFALFLYVNVVAALCIGLRWSHDLVLFLPVAAALAVLSSALLYLAFCSLGRLGPVLKLSRDWPHLIPVALIVVALAIQPRWIEFVLILTKLVYAAMMLLLAQRAPSSLQLVRLHWLSNTQQALWGTAALLLLSVGVDIGITIDFALYQGRHSAQLVGIANLVTVCLLGWASVMAGRGMGTTAQATSLASVDSVKDDHTDVTSQAELVDATKPAPDAEIDDSCETDAQLLQQLNQLLIDQRLYADSNLNLQKLARKVGVPSRAVSRAINSQTGSNVSQWVNGARVDAVCELLVDKNISVTQAMHDAGFLTKSNFNREFRRAKGCSPSQWRAEH